MSKAEKKLTVGQVIGAVVHLPQALGEARQLFRRNTRVPGGVPATEEPPTQPRGRARHADQIFGADDESVDKRRYTRAKLQRRGWDDGEHIEPGAVKKLRKELPKKRRSRQTATSVPKFLQHHESRSRKRREATNQAFDELAEDIRHATRVELDMHHMWESAEVKPEKETRAEPTYHAVRERRSGGDGNSSDSSNNTGWS